MMPGATALTVTPSATTSMASARFRPSPPAWAAAWAASVGSALTGPAVAERLTMRPQPRSAMVVTNARLVRNAVVRLRSISTRHSSMLSWATGRSTSGLALLARPALLTRTCTSPSGSPIASASAPTSASTVRSATNPTAPSSAARSWIRFVVDTIATVAPSERSRAAIAKPIPSGLPAPVTSATRPSSRSPSNPMRRSCRRPPPAGNAWRHGWSAPARDPARYPGGAPARPLLAETMMTNPDQSWSDPNWQPSPPSPALGADPASDYTAPQPAYAYGTPAYGTPAYVSPPTNSLAIASMIVSI